MDMIPKFIDLMTKLENRLKIKIDNINYESAMKK